MAPGNAEKTEKKEGTAVLDQLHAVVKEMVEAAKNGDLDTRADSTQLKGSAKKVVEELNQLIDAYATPLDRTADYIEQIAQGMAPEKIEDECHGVFGKIKDSLNTCIDVNDGLLTEFAGMMEGVMEGNLDVRGNPEALPGGWGQFVEVINSMVEQFVVPFRLTAQYVDRISKGDIPEKNEEEFSGEFNDIKENLNQTIDTLNQLLSDMQQTIDAQKEGDIEARCHPELFQGSYAELSQGINDTLDVVITPVVDGIEIMTEFAEGNFEKKMRELPGKQVVLTEGLNGIRRNLLSLIEEINSLIGAAVAGDLNARADTEAHTGEFKNILNGFNETLDAIIRPIQESNQVLQELAQGNLTLRVQGEYQGDHALIKDAINSAMDNLHELLASVTDNSMLVASSSAELASASDQMATGAEEQTAQTGEVATAVEEMTATISEVARNANSAAEGSKDAMNSAQQGGEVVSQTINGMNSIAATVTQAAHTIGELGKRADEIGEIVGVVDVIADQTNLLALNAAIEAARAGEHGRGFAVVADEVRKLAEKTTDATKEVAKVIKAIQKETQQAVNAMESGTREVEEGTTLANQAGTALSQIVDGANRVTEMVIQIAAAAEEQSAAAEEIARNIEGINNVARQSAAGASQSATAAKELSSLAERLQSGITRFRLRVEE